MILCFFFFLQHSVERSESSESNRRDQTIFVSKTYLHQYTFTSFSSFYHFTCLKTLKGSYISWEFIHLLLIGLLDLGFRTTLCVLGEAEWDATGEPQEVPPGAASPDW